MRIELSQYEFDAIAGALERRITWHQNILLVLILGLVGLVVAFVVGHDEGLYTFIGWYGMGVGGFVLATVGLQRRWLNMWEELNGAFRFFRGVSKNTLQVSKYYLSEKTLRWMRRHGVGIREVKFV